MDARTQGLDAKIQDLKAMIQGLDAKIQNNAINQDLMAEAQILRDDNARLQGDIPRKDTELEVLSEF